MFISSLRSRLGTALVPLVASCALAACASTSEVHQAPEEPAPSAATEKDAEKDAEDEAVEELKEARELHFAELGLAIAKLDAEHSTAKSDQDLAEAQREVGEAQRKLDLFVNHEQPKELAEAQLGYDRAAHRRELALDELNELISMYEAEEFAELTKELVLKRGRKSLEFSERGLELERQEQAVLQNETLPKRQRDLEHALLKAQQGLASAELSHAKSRIEVEVSLAKAAHKLEDLQREAAKDDDAKDDDGEDAHATGEDDGDDGQGA